jgi:hypothetical protein
MPYMPPPKSADFEALFVRAMATKTFSYHDDYGRNLLHLAAALLLINEAKQLCEESTIAGLSLADEKDANHKLPSQYAKDAGHRLFAHAIQAPTEAAWLAATIESDETKRTKAAADEAYTTTLRGLGRHPGSCKGE